MADRRLRRMMTGKIHRATVTGADLHYVGSVTVDADLLDAADILPGQEVDVVDVTNGARLTTYAIPGDRGSGVLTINGAAAHLVGEGDRIVERGAEPGRVPSGHGLTGTGLPFADARG